jgi:hypothetical protein
MDIFIQFGLNALGFIVALLICAKVLIAGIGLFVNGMDALQLWVDKNGWND